MKKKQKQILVMTSIGPVPFEVLKDYVDPEISECIESLNKEPEAEFQPPLDLSYYINNLALKRGWKYEKMSGFLYCLYEINKGAAFSTILREVAIELDKKYTDHIKNSDEIYVVSMTNGHIEKMDKKFIRSYGNFAAFRTVDDAKIACLITRDLLRGMFKDGK